MNRTRKVSERRRARRAFSPGSEDPSYHLVLEHRNLAVPVFFSYAPGSYASDDALTQITFAPGSSGGYNEDNGGSAWDGATSTAYGTGQAIINIDPGATGVSMIEQAAATTTVGQPTSDPTSWFAATTIVTALTTQDTVTADANGPYYLGQGHAAQADAGGSLNWDILDDSGGAAAAGSTITISVTISLSPNLDPRFAETAYLQFYSPYLNIFVNLNADADTPDSPTGLTIRDPGGATSTSPSYGTLVLSDPNFGTTSLSDTVSYTDTVTTTIIPVVYSQYLVTGPANGPAEGGFNNETAGQTSAFDLSVGMTLNPP